MHIIRNRKAVSGSISAIFVVLIFLIAASSVFAYHSSQDRYNELVNERHRRDWERQNEKVVIDFIQRSSDGALNATIKNSGAVAARLVTTWLSAFNGSGAPLWQRQYKVDIRINSGETITNFGGSDYRYALICPPAYAVDSILLPDANLNYTVRIVTERGNIAIGRYQRPTPFAPSTVGWFEGSIIIIGPPYSKGGGGGGAQWFVPVKNNGTQSVFLTGGYLIFVRVKANSDPLLVYDSPVGYLADLHWPVPLPPQQSVHLEFRWFSSFPQPGTGILARITLFGIDATRRYFIQTIDYTMP